MTERRLAHIVHQTAKFLVSLLEKEYGFGLNKKPQIKFEVREIRQDE